MKTNLKDKLNLLLTALFIIIVPCVIIFPIKLFIDNIFYLSYRDINNLLSTGKDVVIHVEIERTYELFMIFLFFLPISLLIIKHRSNEKITVIKKTMIVGGIALALVGWTGCYYYYNSTRVIINSEGITSDKINDFIPWNEISEIMTGYHSSFGLHHYHTYFLKTNNKWILLYKGVNPLEIGFGYAITQASDLNKVELSWIIF